MDRGDKDVTIINIHHQKEPKKLSNTSNIEFEVIYIGVI
jgi:hypothetical protein